MAELTDKAINKMIRDYIKGCFDNDEKERQTGKPLNDDTLFGEQEKLDWFLPEFKQDLAFSEYHYAKDDAKRILIKNGFDTIDENSPLFKSLCREILKAKIQIIEVVKKRNVADYNYERTAFPNEVSPFATYSPQLQNGEKKEDKGILFSKLMELYAEVLPAA